MCSLYAKQDIQTKLVDPVYEVTSQCQQHTHTNTSPTVYDKAALTNHYIPWKPIDPAFEVNTKKKTAHTEN